MAEILLEGRDCEACGTEVRKGALFCYHCGASVAPDVVVTTDLDQKVSDARLLEEVAVPVEESVETADETEIIEKSVGEPEESSDETEIAEVDTETAEGESVINEDETETGDEETAIEKDAEKEADEKPKLKTAAAMRRKPKRIQKKRVEIVWEEPASPPNIWFLIATLVFAALAIGLWFVAKSLG